MSFAHLAWMPILLSMSAAYGECTLDAPAGALTFVHRHMVHNFNADPPDWMEDELKLWHSEAGDFCFVLSTLGPNGHQCGADGALEALGKERFRFSADVCSIEFSIQRSFIDLLVTDDWRRRGAGGVCPQRFECGMFGAVQSGRFLAQGKE
jgi:hypothetical protein